MPCSVTADISFDSVLFPLLTRKHVEVNLQQTNSRWRGAQASRDALPEVIADAYEMANRGRKSGDISSRAWSQEPDGTRYTQTLPSRQGCIRLQARAKLETKYGALAHCAAMKAVSLPSQKTLMSIMAVPAGILPDAAHRQRGRPTSGGRASPTGKAGPGCAAMRRRKRAASGTACSRARSPLAM